MAYSAYATSDRGYDLSLFETQGTAARKSAPAKKKKHRRSNIVELPEMEYDKSSRRKHNFASLAVGILMASVIVLIIGVIIHGQVQLAEINQQITSAQVDLEHSQSEYIQMQAKVEASLSTAAVEEYARTQLGMAKATNQQKEYISLSQGDKAQVYTDASSNVFTEIGDFFQSLWS